MNSPLNIPGSHYSEIHVESKSMYPRLQHRQRFISKEHFPKSNGINQAGCQLWICYLRTMPSRACIACLVEQYRIELYAPTKLIFLKKGLNTDYPTLNPGLDNHLY